MRFIRHPSEETPRGHAKDAIKRMILSRGLKVGDKLPPYRDLAAHFGIAVGTIERAMGQLADEGTIQVLHGKGVFIRRLPAGSGQLSAIGLIYPASLWHLASTGYLNQMFSGMLLVCEQNHIDLQIMSLWTPDGPVPPPRLAMRVDGLVLLEMLNERYIAEFAREPIPLVLVDAQTQVSSVHSICVDNACAGQMVMDHLYALGHRRIAYVDGRSLDVVARSPEPSRLDTADTRERREAYDAAAKRLGLEYRRIYTAAGDDIPGLAASILADRSNVPKPPTAILCESDILARELCERLSTGGLRIPKDLSVAAVVGSAGGNAVGSHVVTAAIADFGGMGRRAIQALQRQTTGGVQASSRLERVGCTLQIGTTTVRPRPR